MKPRLQFGLGKKQPSYAYDSVCMCMRVYVKQCQTALKLSKRETKSLEFHATVKYHYYISRICVIVVVDGPSFFLHGTCWLTICIHKTCTYTHIFITIYTYMYIVGNSCFPWHLSPLACDWVKHRPSISLSRPEKISDYWGSTFLISHARWANCSWQFNEFTDQLVGFVCYNDELWNSSNQLVSFISLD